MHQSLIKPSCQHHFILYLIKKESQNKVASQMIWRLLITYYIVFLLTLIDWQFTYYLINVYLFGNNPIVFIMFALSLVMHCPSF